MSDDYTTATPLIIAIGLFTILGLISGAFGGAL